MGRLCAAALTVVSVVGLAKFALEWKLIDVPTTTVYMGSSVSDTNSAGCDRTDMCQSNAGHHAPCPDIKIKPTGNVFAPRNLRATKSMLHRLCFCFLLTLTGSKAYVGLHRRQSTVRSSLQRPLGGIGAIATTTGPMRLPVLESSSFPNDNNENENKAKVRFSGLDLDRPTDFRRPILDQLLAGLTTDLASIAGGLLGLLLLLGGRLVVDDSSDAIIVSPEALGQATRVNLLAVLATGALLLNGISKLDVVAAMADDVVLQGSRVLPPYVDNRLTITAGYVSWMLESLLTASPAGTVVLLEATSDNDDDKGPKEVSPWKLVAWAGIVPPNLSSKTSLAGTPILNRLRNANEETYLPTLQALPGRIEFSYLPANTQAVLLLPVATKPRTVIALGASQARSFTPRDISWCQVVVNRMIPD